MTPELREYIKKQGERLYKDLCYAAPELWELHIQRRMEEITDRVEATTIETGTDETGTEPF